jgi:hypothetical protein
MNANRLLAVRNPFYHKEPTRAKRKSKDKQELAQTLAWMRISLRQSGVVIPQKSSKKSDILYEKERGRKGFDGSD